MRKQDKLLTSENMALLLLKLLTERDMYGYEMKGEICRRSQGTFEVKEGPIYLVLRSLEDNGYVTTELVRVGVRKERRYYYITEEGRKLLDRKMAEWQAYVQAMHDVMNPQE